MKSNIAEIIGDTINGPEGDNSETVVEQQWMKYLHTLNIFWEMCSGIRESVNSIAHTYKGVQLHVNNDKKMFQSGTKLDKVMDELWKLVQINKRSYRNKIR